MMRAFRRGAAAAAGAIAALVATILIVDAFARAPRRRREVPELRFSYGGGRRPVMPDDVRDRWGAH